MNTFDLTPFLEHTAEYHVSGVTVVQDGQEIARHVNGQETAGNIYSGTKSFTSAATGFAVAEGMFSLEDRVIDHFPEDLPEKISENLAKMKLVHLLTMSMGFEKPVLMGAMRPAMVEKDWVKFVLRQNVAYNPGEKFLYNNAGPYLLGVLIQRKSGQNLVEYLKPRMLDPLGIHVETYEKCPMGYMFGAGGLCINLTDFAKLGQLYLQKGIWNGKQLLPEAWVTATSTEFIKAPAHGDEEIGDGYGYFFWTMNDGVFRADGKYEQYSIICPKKNAVVTIKAMNTEAEQNKPVLRAALRYIVNQL